MTYLNTGVMYSPKRGSDRELFFKGAARWRPVSGPQGRRGWARRPDRGVPGLAACLLVGRGGVFGDPERLSRGKTDAGGGRADHSDLARRRRDFAGPGRNGLPDHAARPVRVGAQLARVGKGTDAPAPRDRNGAGGPRGGSHSSGQGGRNEYGVLGIPGFRNRCSTASRSSRTGPMSRTNR